MDAKSIIDGRVSRVLGCVSGGLMKKAKSFAKFSKYLGRSLGDFP